MGQDANTPWHGSHEIHVAVSIEIFLAMGICDTLRHGEPAFDQTT